MMTYLLAAAAATQPVQGADPDLHCMAGYLIVAGDNSPQAAMSAEDRAGVQSLVMYYFGKLDARFPGADLEGSIKSVIQSPGYGAQVKADLERCNAEATSRGKYLEAFGDGKDPASPPAASPAATAPTPAAPAPAAPTPAAAARP